MRVSVSILALLIASQVIAADEGTPVDYEGTPWTTSEPVVLPTTLRDAPRPKGNWYRFDPQQAKQVVNLSRFPKFATSPMTPLVYQWKLYDTLETFDLRNYGMSHLVVTPVMRQGGYVTPTNLPRTQRVSFHGDSFLYGNANKWADEIGDETDERVIHLRALANQHRMVIHQPTLDLLAVKSWEDVKSQVGQGLGVDYVCFDIETDMHPSLEKMNSGNPNQWETDLLYMMGALYLKMGELAHKDGIPIKIFSYGVQPVKEKNEETRNLLSNYLTVNDTNADPYENSTHPMVLAYQKFGGFIGRDQYARTTWSDQTWYKKTDDGHYLMQDGRRVLRDDFYTTTLYGQEVKLAGADPDYYNEKESSTTLKWFTHELSAMYAYDFFLNGGKTRRKYSEKNPVWAKTEMCRWLRYDTEPFSAPGAKLGARPIYDKQMELTVMLRSLRGAQWFWQAEKPQIMGKEYEGMPTSGSIEIAIKARHRAENLLVPFFKQYKDWWYIRPTRGLVEDIKGDLSQNPQDAPVMTGLLAGRSVLLLSCFWAQDENETSEMVCWYDDGKVKSPSYRIVHEGRDTFFDRWELPKTIKKAEPQYLYFQFKDINGNLHTVSGDYAYPVEGQPTPPPRYKGTGNTGISTAKASGS